MNGSRHLTEYLNAPEHVQRQFDKRLDDEIRKSLEAERAIADLTWDDPYATPTPADPIPLRWDASWSKRAKRPAPKPGEPEPYSRDTDPLLDLDLREVWDALTGTEVRGEMASCPLPDHHDRFPSCTVKAEFWRCHSCDKGGSIIDLGAAVYGMEPRGRSFFDIRRRLLGELGMEGERAA